MEMSMFKKILSLVLLMYASSSFGSICIRESIKKDSQILDFLATPGNKSLANYAFLELDIKGSVGVLQNIWQEIHGWAEIDGNESPTYLFSTRRTTPPFRLNAAGSWEDSSMRVFASRIGGRIHLQIQSSYSLAEKIKQIRAHRSANISVIRANWN